MSHDPIMESKDNLLFQKNNTKINERGPPDIQEAGSGAWGIYTCT